MKFSSHSSELSDRAYDALEFLRNAYMSGMLAEIENMEDVFGALDISQNLAYANQRLKSYHIED